MTPSTLRKTQGGRAGDGAAQKRRGGGELAGRLAAGGALGIAAEEHDRGEHREQEGDEEEHGGAPYRRLREVVVRFAGRRLFGGPPDSRVDDFRRADERFAAPHAPLRSRR